MAPRVAGSGVIRGRDGRVGQVGWGRVRSRARTMGNSWSPGQAQDQYPGVADQAGGDADQPVPQGGDHGLAVADAETAQRSCPGWLCCRSGCGDGAGLVATSWCNQPARLVPSSAPHIQAVSAAPRRSSRSTTGTSPRPATTTN